MAEEKKGEGAVDPFKIALKEVVERETNAMMKNFAQILLWLATGDTSPSNNHSRSATPFKVQVNFDIPIFEG